MTEGIVVPINFADPANPYVILPISKTLSSEGGGDILNVTLDQVGVRDMPRWLDRARDGKVDVEVDFDGGPGNFFFV